MYSKLYDLEENITVVEGEGKKKHREKERSYFISCVFPIFCRRRRRRHSPKMFKVGNDIHYDVFQSRYIEIYSIILYTFLQ
jgi:hypothetical protein